MVVDEVQSGIGRTGHWFASQAEGVRPDVITLAKGLGGGLPIGACLGIGAAGELFAPGDHGSTFGGNPVSCAAALAVLDTIERDGLLENVKRVGEHLADALDAHRRPAREQRTRQRPVARARAHRSAGAGDRSGCARTGPARQRREPDVIRLAPPLILTEADVDEAVPLLAAAVQDVS